jgi:ABC-2 type transport system ATP-binding protein
VCATTGALGARPLALIELRDVSKYFTLLRRRAGGGPLAWARPERTSVRAVNGVSFTVEEGETVGYIGPNGAGKSTTIKMLTGILVPSQGSLSVAGLDPARDRVELARRIGVVFGHRTQLWWDLPLRDSFELLRYVYRIPPSRYRINIELFVEMLALSPILDTPVRQLSLGQRMRGDLAAAMLHDPAILFLDEPTIGLDVVAKERIREFLQTLNVERGVSIMLTTHDMSDVERLSRRVLIIDEGNLIYDGHLGSLVDRFDVSSTLLVDLERTCPPLDVPGAEAVRVDGPRQWLRFKRSETSAAQLIATVAERVRLVDLAIQEPAIEDIIRRIYQRGSA